VALQIVIIFAGTQGYVDKFPVSSLKRYEKDLYAFLKDKHKDVMEDIHKRKTLDDDLKKKLDKVLNDFNKTFEA